MPDDFGVERLKDLYRVHDTTKKAKKEQKRGDDDREFKDFLEEHEKEPEGYRDFFENEELPQPPAVKMLDMLGAQAPLHFKIEPMDVEEEKKKIERAREQKRAAAEAPDKDE